MRLSNSQFDRFLYGDKLFSLFSEKALIVIKAFEIRESVGMITNSVIKTDKEFFEATTSSKFSPPHEISQGVAQSPN